MQTQITKALDIGGVIIFKDKSKKFISKEEFDFIAKGSGSSFFLNGNRYDFFSVSKILDIDEYYQEYPDQRPELIKDYSNVKPVKITKERWAKGMKGLIKGYKSYFDGREMNGEQKLFLMKMDRRLWERGRAFNNPVDDAKELICLNGS